MDGPVIDDINQPRSRRAVGLSTGNLGGGHGTHSQYRADLAELDKKEKEDEVLLSLLPSALI
jgi:hypothetical protein